MAILSEQGITVLAICISVKVFCCLHTRREYAAAALRCSMLFFVALVIIFAWLYIYEFIALKFTELDNSAAFVKNLFLRYQSIRNTLQIASYSYLWSINLQLLLLTYWLCAEYILGCIPPITGWDDYPVLSLPAMAFLLVAIIYVLYNFNNRILIFTFGAAVERINFFPAGNLLIIVGFNVAKRVLYLPSVGFCIMVAVIHVRASRYYHNMDKIYLTVLVIAIKMKYQRYGECRTELDLYASGSRVFPENAKIHCNLGKVLSKIGNVDAVKHNSWNAVRLNPNYEHASNNLANIMESEGKSVDAEHLQRQALRKRPAQ